MDISKELCRMLEEKKQLFLQYEKATHALLESDADTAPNYITQRAELANRIDGIIEEIGRLCDHQDNASLLMDITAGRARYEAVPAEFRDVYERAEEIQSIAWRIREQETGALHHFEVLRDEAMSKIKQNQNVPKIKKYLNDLQEQPGQGTLTDGKA